MKLEFHPPMVVTTGSLADDDPDLVRLVHAHLWLSIDAPQWRVVRQGHLHAVRPEHAPGDWRRVDLAGHPLRLWLGRCDEVPLEGVASELTCWLTRNTLTLYRLPALDAVSELGEGVEDFRRRILAGVGGELRERIEQIERAPRSRLPWRRRSEESDRLQRRGQLASAVAGLGRDIEQLTVEEPAECIVRAEAGLLLVGVGIRLPSPTSRDLITG